METGTASSDTLLRFAAALATHDPATALTACSVALGDPTVAVDLDDIAALRKLIRHDVEAVRAAATSALAERLSPSAALDVYATLHGVQAWRMLSRRVIDWQPFDRPATIAAIRRAEAHSRAVDWDTDRYRRTIEWFVAADAKVWASRNAPVPPAARMIAAAVAADAVTFDEAFTAVFSIDASGRFAAELLRAASVHTTNDRADRLAPMMSAVNAAAASGPVCAEFARELLYLGEPPASAAFLAAVRDGTVRLHADVVEQCQDVSTPWFCKLTHGLWAASSATPAAAIAVLRRLKLAIPQTPEPLLWLSFAVPAGAPERAELIRSFASHAERIPPTVRRSLDPRTLDVFDDEIAAAAAPWCYETQLEELIARRPAVAALLADKAFASAAVDGSLDGSDPYVAAARSVAWLFEPALRARLLRTSDEVTKTVDELSRTRWHVHRAAAFAAAMLGDDRDAWQLFAQLLDDGSELCVADLVDTAARL